jgi:phage protein D
MAEPAILGSASASTDDTVDLLVKLGGKQLSGDAAACLLDVSIKQDVGHAAQLTLRLAAWDSDTQELTWTDDSALAPGTTVEVDMGYLGSAVPMFAGEIVGLDLEASPTERAVLTITAYDILHRLGRGQRRKSYEKTTYAAIVRKIAQEVYKLEADAKDDRSIDPEHDVVNQQNLSDLDFMLRLAGEIGYELFADGKRLVFRKSHVGESPELTLDASRDLIQFTATLSAADQLGGVDVLAFNSDTKQSIKVSADNVDGSDQNYGAVPSRLVIVGEPITSEEQAKARANVELLRIRTSYLEGSGSCLGRTDLRAGMTIQIDNLGNRFGGAYYVPSVTHSLSAGGGLRTRFTLKGQPR